MKFIQRSHKIGVGAAGVVLVLLAAGFLFISAPKAQAQLVSGDPGPASSSSSGSGFYTSHGHGWERFDIASPSGPSGGFKSGSWSSVVSQCSAVGADKAWVYVIRNSSGDEKSYTFQNTNAYYGYNNSTTKSTGGSGRDWWVDRPSEGSDPYMYNADGNYTGTGLYGSMSGYGAEENIVASVRSKFQSEGGSLSSWGFSVGWFCWHDNPPWTITVDTKVNAPIAEVGDTITWTHTIQNSGNPTNKDVNWGYNNSGDFSGSGGSAVLASGTKSGGGDSQTSSYIVKPADFGKKFCRSTYAAPASNTGGSTETDPPVCVTIVKKPKTQVRGGDLSVGRAFNNAGSASSLIVTSQSISGGKTYGSWGEYALAASGAIQGPGSGAALLNGLNTASECDYSKLSVTNTNVSTPGTTCTAGNIGNYSNVGKIPDVASQFSVNNSTPIFSNLSDVQYKRIEKATSNVNLPAATIEKGQWLVLNAAGQTVNITGNISYTNAPLSSIDDIPQLIIIADTINISGRVTQVDAWLVADGPSGTINTCSDVSAGAKLYATICTNQLTVDGPVMAKHLYLQRTAGGDAGLLGKPAEMFNLRADTYLWGAARSLEGLHVSVASTSDLPPRF